MLKILRLKKKGTLKKSILLIFKNLCILEEPSDI